MTRGHARMTSSGRTIGTARDGTMSRRVADGLREAILGGQYPPGTRIRQEAVAEQYGASRLPVREALRTLADEGLVTLVANTGAWVARLSLAECEELYLMRERLEPLLLRYSMPGLDGVAVARLAALADEMEASSDVEAFLSLDREFHQLSYTGATTAQLGENTARLWNSTQHYRRAFTNVFRAEGDRTVHHEHQLLVHAIRREDSDDAERILYGHIRRTRLELERHPELFA